MTRPTTSLRDLRQRRDRADDWIVYASWTAIGVAVLGGLLALARLVDADDTNPIAVLLLVSSYVSQGLFGWKLRQRSTWAAWVLMTAFGLAVVANALVNGVWSGVMWNLLIGTMYVRGFLATGAYKELSTQIAAAEHQRPDGPDGSVPAPAT